MAFWILSHLAFTLGFLLAGLVIAQVVRQRRSSSGTIARLLVIVLLPYVGVPLYLMFGGRKLRRIADAKADIQLATGSIRLAARSNLIDRLLQSYGIPGATTGNRVTLCRTGEEGYGAIVQFISEATRSLYLTTFILHKDDIGKDIVDRLAKRAAEGIEVRLLLDGVGSMHMTRRFLAPLIHAGGHVACIEAIFAH
ncbi:MAG: PLDc N-terminal domain-containing protein [Gammaproteobacteria bacterium]|nr:PLDc N-terminal domain-containing protein [Gammaproteobacteria bacterium]MCI0590154.1 PLDc N-terminal domain-containing protein [Gammaproteobacteria bacterium]